MEINNSRNQVAVGSPLIHNPYYALTQDQGERKPNYHYLARREYQLNKAIHSHAKPAREERQAQEKLDLRLMLDQNKLFKLGQSTNKLVLPPIRTDTGGTSQERTRNNRSTLVASSLSNPTKITSNETTEERERR